MEDQAEDKPSLSVSFDNREPGSLVHMLPPGMAKRIYDLSPSWLNLSEHESRKMCKPTSQIEMVRLAFWSEVYRCHELGLDKLDPIKFYSGICSSQLFTNCMINVPKVLQFIINQPASYKHGMEHCLDLGVRRLREIFRAPVLDHKGNLIVKNAELMLKAFMVVDNRVKGSVIQKSEVKQLGLHLHKGTSDKDVSKYINPQDLELLDAKIRDLEKETRKTKPAMIAARAEVQEFKEAFPVTDVKEDVFVRIHRPEGQGLGDGEDAVFETPEPRPKPSQDQA